MRLPAIAVVVASLTFPTGAAAQTSADAGKSFLWKVHAGTKVLYLAGSVHALGADAYPLSAAYENAFAAAGTTRSKVVKLTFLLQRANKWNAVTEKLPVNDLPKGATVECLFDDGFAGEKYMI